jgi:hypothetical protein
MEPLGVLSYVRRIKRKYKEQNSCFVSDVVLFKIFSQILYFQSLIELLLKGNMQIIIALKPKAGV